MLAHAIAAGGEPVRIVKLVQTGVRDGEPGDAKHAAELAGCEGLELARFWKPADPWTAALSEGMPAVHAEDLALVLQRLEGNIVAEGAGGLAVPLNRTQTFADVVRLSALEPLLVVGLRLGCINHALLTAAALQAQQTPLAGAVLVDRWEDSGTEYHDDVRRALQEKMRILGIVRFDADDRRSIDANTELFKDLLS